ncbi:hypothetical protein DFR58_14814 [Anaerobacterium chartisolvens]|uniref:DUF5348 domain-containing protein n=1 Tax=Anaerobacterium chartisolvens TaxID=1297424 RepID=A0A369AEW4_9FIRM|nr:DUF5348 domain-containing protein [Anaerobacterium chartisolvens]RCX07880.1 hypothetical protein DFR58_14814 [Anaerobacterium chartisolvens]
MKGGALFYNPENDRMGIYFDDGTTESGLHCGDPMEVKVDGKWVSTRLEMSEQWYLVGIKDVDSIDGLKVRL